MYNEIILIILSVFAVFGMYSAIREFFVLFCEKSQLVVAIRIAADSQDENINDSLIVAYGYIDEHYILERRPVFICDDLNSECIGTLQHDVYVKYTEE